MKRKPLFIKIILVVMILLLILQILNFVLPITYAHLIYKFIPLIICFLLCIPLIVWILSH